MVLSPEEIPEIMAAFFCPRCRARDGRYLVYRGIDEAGEIACTEVRSDSDEPSCGHPGAEFRGLVIPYHILRQVVTDPVAYRRWTRHFLHHF